MHSMMWVSIEINTFTMVTMIVMITMIVIVTMIIIVATIIIVTMIINIITAKLAYLFDFVCSWKSVIVFRDLKPRANLQQISVKIFK